MNTQEHELKKHIVAEYDEVSKQSQEIPEVSSKRRNDFHNLVKASFDDWFCRKVNVYLNELAKKFDEHTNELRKKEAADKKTYYLEARHTFIAIRKDKKGANPVTAHMYFAELPPDKRIIRIEIDKHLHWVSTPLISTLHEMGHFLGPRHRENRYTLYLPKLVINAFFEQIYQRTCCAFTGMDVDYGVYNFIGPLFPTDVRNFSNQVISVLNNAQKGVYRHFRYMCAQSDKSIQTESGKAEIASDLAKKKNVELSKKYLAKARSIMLANLQQLTKDPDKFFQVFIKPEIDKLPNRDKNPEELLKESLAKVAENLHKDLKADQIPGWYKTCENELEEPVADIFLLKASGISFKKYVKHILRLYQCANENNEHGEKHGPPSSAMTELRNVIQKDDKVIRFIGIAWARKEPETVFQNWYDGVIRFLPIRFKSRQRYEARCLLSKIYHQELKDATPHHRLVYRYIQEIWQDERYQDVYQFARRSKWKWYWNCFLDEWIRHP